MGDISIHVPREGHDTRSIYTHLRNSISIHVPREGHDLFFLLEFEHICVFLSTCPVRGTTNLREIAAIVAVNFYPRAP